MVDTKFGTYIPDLATFTDEEERAAEHFCPSAKVSDAEDTLAKECLPVDQLEYLDGLGYYQKTYAGYALEGDFRSQGSSAGLVNWLCAKLLEDGHVDSVLHVKEAVNDDGTMYSYQESTSVEALQTGAKSKYYPIELSGVLKLIEQAPNKKVAVVALPCFLKGLRALEKKNPTLKKQIKFHIGIVCGHLKSKNYAEFLGWQAGIEPENLRLIDYRTKLSGRPASRYGFTAIPKVGDEDSWVITPMTEVVGGNWGHGVFKLKACEYCDDVMAETADIVFGDAWLPEFVADSQGTNILNSRSLFLTELLEREAEKSNVKLIELSPERVLDSQRSGLRHRREGLSYRSARDMKKGEAFPVKRVSPGSHKLTKHRKLTYDYRETIRTTSHSSFIAAKEHKDLHVALSALAPVIQTYAKLNQTPLRNRVINKVKRIGKKLLNVRS
ncbi:MAG: Coenzyme F420 hydrogenase/dehydrogenase, beta subunit C-terminal domain [Idiomarina sp.]|nr:Coenzyme F420 hydrogenase/dehydrogenase, beta subunit C-terminal domain [Idiomarina sp.]